ncbi:MAG: hypothetical protein IR527_01205 [Bacteroides sp.]|nr:MAG: hypothetical protein IR527_01205 [Bacteroides sp.]
MFSIINNIYTIILYLDNNNELQINCIFNSYHILKLNFLLFFILVFFYKKLNNFNKSFIKFLFLFKISSNIIHKKLFINFLEKQFIISLLYIALYMVKYQYNCCDSIYSSIIRYNNIMYLIILYIYMFIINYIIQKLIPLHYNNIITNNYLYFYSLSLNIVIFNLIYSLNQNVLILNILHFISVLILIIQHTKYLLYTICFIKFYNLNSFFYFCIVETIIYLPLCIYIFLYISNI